MTLIVVLVWIVLVFLILEAIARYCYLRYVPLGIRLLYASFLLSPKRAEEAFAIAQRVKRGTMRTQCDLFKHYAAISGKSFAEIDRKFSLGRMPLRGLVNGYSSGGHGIMELRQQMHIGLTPRPGQKLNTLEIDMHGRRKTGYEPNEEKTEVQPKLCLLLGGSAAFGLGATGNEHTIAGRLGYYLNTHFMGKPKFHVVNGGILGMNCLQELIALLQSNVKADYVIALSGWNEIDQHLSSDSPVASYARSCDKRANDPPLWRLFKDFCRYWTVFTIAERFVIAFLAYDQAHREERNGDAVNVYPLY